MQLDAEEDESAFYKPPVEPAARGSEDRHDTDESETHTAAVVTAEEEDD